MGATSSGDFLGIYLNDHLAAASGGRFLISVRAVAPVFARNVLPQVP